MNKAWLLLLLTVLVCGQCKRKSGGDPAPPQADPVAVTDAKVILTIDGTTRTNRDLKRFIQLQYGDMVEKKDNGRLLSRLFDVFCEQQLILFEADRQGIQVGDDAVDAYIGEIQSRSKAVAIDQEIVRNVLKVQEYLLSEVYKDVAIGDAEVAAFYEAHLDEFRKGEEIELFQIMVAEREKLLKIRSELVGRPSRFEEIARRESLSPEAARGGAMGFFEKGMLPQEMEEVVFSLKVNEISPIVESPYGFHIFKISRKRRSRMQLLAAVQDQIKSKLLSAKLESAYASFLDGLKSRLAAQVHYDQLYFAYNDSQSAPGVNNDKTEDFSGRVSPAGD
ncbi:MAG: peptidylprolyl isomerase [Candidatus Aminicenantes bacterium]|nr:peptidylprolyl isomerase [Candidatus Aminicenantes bacterium]